MGVHHPSSGYYDVEKALKYWQPMYDLDGDIEGQLLALFPEGMADNSMLDDHMAHALSQLAEGDTSLEHSLRLLEVKLRERLLNSPADDPQHLTQEDVEGAIGYIDTLKSVKTLWNLEQPEQLFQPSMRPDSEESEFMPWFSSLVPLLQQACLLVEDGLSTQSVLDQIQKEWNSMPRMFKEADGSVTTMYFGKLDLENALKDVLLMEITRLDKAYLLSQSSSRSPNAELQRSRSMASSPRILRPVSGGGGLNAIQQGERLDDDFWDDNTTLVEPAPPQQVSHRKTTEYDLQQRPFSIDQQRSRRRFPSEIPEIDYSPSPPRYCPMDPNLGEQTEEPRSFTSEKVKKPDNGSESVHKRRFRTPSESMPDKIARGFPKPDWLVLEDFQALRDAQKQAKGIESLHSTPHLLRDRLNNNVRLPQEAQVEDTPPSSGNGNPLPPVAGEIEDPVAGKAGGPVASEAEGPVVGQVEVQVADGPVADQILQGGPVEMVADPAAPLAPPRKAKSRKGSRYISRHTPYGRPGQHSARSRTVRGRRSRRSPSRSEDGLDSQVDSWSINKDLAEVTQGVNIDAFGKVRHIPDNMAPEQKLQLIAKQKSMLLRMRNMYSSGKDKHLAAQRIEYTEGLHEGLEFDEMMVEFEMEDV